MNVTKRTKLSLSQFLDLFNQEVIFILFQKHEVTAWEFNQIAIANALSKVDPSSIETLIDEIIRTKSDLRNRVSPRYRFDERWGDFLRCLLLDGYKIENEKILRIEPRIEGNEHVEDDLSNELVKSILTSAMDIANHVKHSADSFKQASPNYSDCLVHSRIALETLVREIAKYESKDENYDDRWGKSLSCIKKLGIITDKEEHAIASTYAFASEGAHRPLGFTEEEFSRFGRSLAMSMCYFLIKKFNARQSASPA